MKQWQLGELTSTDLGILLIVVFLFFLFSLERWRSYRISKDIKDFEQTQELILQKIEMVIHKVDRVLPYDEWVRREKKRTEILKDFLSFAQNLGQKSEKPDTERSLHNE